MKAWTYCSNEECDLQCERKLNNYNFTNEEIKSASIINLKKYKDNNTCKLFIQYKEDVINEKKS